MVVVGIVLHALPELVEARTRAVVIGPAISLFVLPVLLTFVGTLLQAFVFLF